jgi:hypothetical protein
MTATLLLLLTTAGQVPTFTVENKCPPAFTVVSLLPPKKTAAPGVVAKPIFRSGGEWSGHNCPNCGREQKVVTSGIPNTRGHTHTCPNGRCTDDLGVRTWWWH